MVHPPPSLFPLQLRVVQGDALVYLMVLLLLLTRWWRRLGGKVAMVMRTPSRDSTVVVELCRGGVHAVHGLHDPFQLLETA